MFRVIYSFHKYLSTLYYMLFMVLWPGNNGGEESREVLTGLTFGGGEGED